MTDKNARTLVLLSAAAFLAAAFFPFVAGAQETGQPAAPGQAAVEPGHRLAGLGLTPGQVKALDEFRKSRLEERRAFRDEMAKLRDEMRELSKDPQGNQVKIDALIDKRAALRTGREKAALRMRLERNIIFTPDQLEKLRSFRTRRMGRRRDRAIMGPGRFGHTRDGRFIGSRARTRRTARLWALRHGRLWRWQRR